jgi:predicted Zn finger-like uncharacterized protein
MKTQCPNCKSKFNVNETNIGKQAKCPKCSKTFIIKPFVETPVAVETSAKSPKPVESPAKNPEAVAPPTKITAPTKAPVKSPEPVKIPVKTASPAAVPPIKDEKPEPKAASKTALSKTVFVYGWAIVRIIAGVLGALGLMMAIRKNAYSTLIKTFAAADMFLILGISIELVLYYRMWAAIQDREVSISPAKAVLFLFIPVFNVYWMLNMLIGFAEDYSSFIQRHSIKIKELPVMLFIIYAFLSLLTAIVVTVPMLCVFGFARRIYGAFTNYTQAAWAIFFFISAAGIAHFITYILVSIKTCNAVNALTSASATSG